MKGTRKLRFTVYIVLKKTTYYTSFKLFSVEVFVVHHFFLSFYHSFVLEVTGGGTHFTTLVVSLPQTIQCRKQKY